MTRDMKKIYLDYAATTPLDKEVEKAMRPYYFKMFGNPMSLHSFGREASKAVEKSRSQVADFLSAEPEEIIFTSGATESNNWALKGMTKSYREKHGKPHIITTKFEHHCILDSCSALEKNNKAEITFLPISKQGIVNIDDIQKAIKKNTLLVSIMYVNNEIGTIQPIAEIGKMLSKINKTRRDKIYFHTDATQAINYLDCDVNKLNIDLLSMSGHKIHGPKGVGCLYIRKGTPVARKQDGGGQEFGKRAGTHNVPGIVGLGKAIELVTSNQSSVNSKITKMRDWLIKKVLKEIPDSWLNGDLKLRTPNNANFGFRNVEGEALILMLDSYGIAASTGSACSSGSLEPSHVLLSLGLKPEEAHGSLRITLGKGTTREDIQHTFKTLKKVVSDLRKISGNVLDDYYKNNSSQKSIKS